MDDYAGRVLADRYRLPLPPSDEYELAESRAFDTYSGQEVLVRQVPLPEIVEAEVVGEGEPRGAGPAGLAGPYDAELDVDDLPAGFVPRARSGGAGIRRAASRTTRRPTDPAVRRAIEAAQTAAQIPDHPRLDQVFDVFAEGGSLWIVSELVAARPLAALLADRPLSPYRAAEVAADVLAALRVLHAYGWVHRNITARTVLICDDGRVMLTGLAAGAAEEALCGYDPRPVEAGEAAGSAGSVGNVAGYGEAAGAGEPRGAREVGGVGGVARAGASALEGARYDSGSMALEPAPESAGRDPKGGRAGGAIAAYHAGARAAARVSEASGVYERGRREAGSRGSDAGGIGARGSDAEVLGAHGTGSSGSDDGGSGEGASGVAGRISDPYGVAVTKPWHGAVPRGRVPAARRADAPRGDSAGGAEHGQGDGRGHEGGFGSGHEGGFGSSPGSGREGGFGGGPGSGREGGFGGGPGSGRESEVGSGPESGHESPHTPRDARGGWDDGPGDGAASRGPTTALAAERARHARMVVVGPVTERWAPEQAGPVHENWRLAAPIGPATDLWALGALLFRAVQGHAPYPEDSTAELVQLVCAEPPAFAEECGALRPVVESLLRQDPTERIDFEELSGWLRSLVRSAPEPEAGAHVVPVPAYDAGRLPVVRRRGEVVRRRRGGVSGGGTGFGHGRHKRGRGKGKDKGGHGREGREMPLAASARPPHEPRPLREPRLSHESELPHESRESRDPHGSREPRGSRTPKAARNPTRNPGRPRSLGRLLLIAILIGLAAAFVYAMVFMPKNDDGASGDRAGAAGEVSSAPSGKPDRSNSPSGSDDSDDSDKDENKDKDKDKPGKSPSSQEPQTGGPEVPRGFTVRKDPAGFRVAVASGWDRQPKNGRDQVRYTHGDFELLLVPGRDTTDGYGGDPMKYQREHERELQPFRDSTWATSSGMRRIDVGGRAMAEGQFTWQDDAGHEVFVRNLAMVVAGKYHVVQVRGPEAERDEVTRLYEQASATYQATD
ncbi:protein kinase [Streptomyces sp. NPDC005863]|uniref:protein kinase n=1 Tax=unclassified Streptomyces TaxID=2593676 RepID=UPI0033FD6127